MKPVIGIVVSNKMQKSIVVKVDRLYHDKLYNKYYKKSSKFMAHDENNDCNMGDQVQLKYSRPLSKSKDWIVEKILSRARYYTPPSRETLEKYARATNAPQYPELEKSSESEEAELRMASEDTGAISKPARKRSRPPPPPAANNEEDLDLSSDIKGIISALQHLRDKAHKDGQKKTDEIINSVSIDVKSLLRDSQAKLDKDRQGVIRAATKTCKECENALKSEAEKFKAAYEKFAGEKGAYLKAYKDIFSKFEEDKEKLLTKFEQQRKKEKNTFLDLQKTCTEKISFAEESLKKSKQDDKSFSILRKSLGSFLQGESDEDDIEA